MRRRVSGEADWLCAAASAGGCGGGAGGGDGKGRGGVARPPELEEAAAAGGEVRRGYAMLCDALRGRH